MKDVIQKELQVSNPELIRHFKTVMAWGSTFEESLPAMFHFIKRGFFEQADSGPIFMDEIGELPLKAQVRLLRILETMAFQRVGSSALIERERSYKRYTRTALS